MMTTKTYLEMCKKATEIQKEWKSKPGDIILLKSGFTDIVEVCCNEKEFTWIPIQEDLQEIIFNFYGKDGMHPMIDIGHVLAAFNRYHEDLWLNKQIKYPWNQFNTLNELWLSFVMGTVFGKVWNKDKWIYIEE